MVKTLVRYVYKPLLVKYLSKNRHYTRYGIQLEIPPQVFHPGFFFSTNLLIGAIGREPLQNRTLLELGAGSGLIAMHAARLGAVSTASDINPIAIEYLHKNSHCNQVALRIIHSDLFTDIPLEAFDVIAINPPYYKKDPQTPGEYAWYCGKKGEYFENLFSDLGNYMHERSWVLMTLCDGCDLDMIHTMAAAKGFRMHCIHERKNLLETNFVYHIEKL